MEKLNNLPKRQSQGLNPGSLAPEPTLPQNFSKPFSVPRLTGVSEQLCALRRQGLSVPFYRVGN